MPLNLSKPLTFEDLNKFSHGELLIKTQKYCQGGQAMHPQSLKVIVLKLIYVSKDLTLRQEQRDTAANIANGLANAAIKSYGMHSEYSLDLIHSIQTIQQRS